MPQRKRTIQEIIEAGRAGKPLTRIEQRDLAGYTSAILDFLTADLERATHGANAYKSIRAKWVRAGQKSGEERRKVMRARLLQYAELDRRAAELKKRHPDLSEYAVVRLLKSTGRLPAGLSARTAYEYRRPKKRRNRRKPRDDIF